MDVRLFAQALGRHKLIAFVGVLLTIAFAFLSYVSVNPFRDPVFRYRAEQTWVSRTVLQIQESGFTEGKADNPGRQGELAQLAPLYATLAESDAVKQRVKAGGFSAVDDVIVADAVVDSSRASLPLVKIAVFSPSGALAAEHVRRQARAFIQYMADRQASAGIPKKSRVLLSVIQGVSEPTVSQPRKKTLPIVVALAMLILTAALVLVVDNARRRRDASGAVLPVESDVAIAPTAQGGRPTPVAKAPAARVGAVPPPSTGAVAPRARKHRAMESSRRPEPVVPGAPAEQPRERSIEVTQRPASIAPWRTSAADAAGDGNQLRQANTNEE